MEISPAKNDNRLKNSLCLPVLTDIKNWRKFGGGDNIAFQQNNV